ncbi:hypothetical protein HRbin01_00043 [archaeon HR01]|nr:hypothetical protein HRbin01_00043 [archaeon HR01]
MATRLKKNILKLMKKDEEFRYAVAGLLGLEEILKRLDKHEAELVRLREEANKLREDMNRGFELLTRNLSAIGARWGIMSESAFRQGLMGILEKELGLTVEKWATFDEKGYVYGYPSVVDIDIAIRDGRVTLVEVKSHVRRSDVAEFSRKIEFYRGRTGKTPDRKLIVTPYIEAEAVEAAENLGIEVYTQL